MKTHELVEMLRKKYPKDAYALLFEVRNATGYASRERYADAIGMSLWPSRGLEVLGFEMKVSRSDWLKELATPGKAEAICKYCDRWFIVAPPKIVRSGELPATWGLLEVKRGCLVVTTPAPKLQPEVMPVSFIASLFREAQRQLTDEAQVDRIVNKRVNAERKDIMYVESRKSEMLEARLQELEKVVHDFEKSSGVRLSSRWAYPQKTPADIGNALKMILDGGPINYIKDLELLRNRLTHVVESMDMAIVGLKRTPVVPK